MRREKKKCSSKMWDLTIYTKGEVLKRWASMFLFIFSYSEKWVKPKKYACAPLFRYGQITKCFYEKETQTKNM